MFVSPSRGSSGESDSKQVALPSQGSADSRLQAALLGNGNAVSVQVQSWLSRYEGDNLEAVRELATLMCEAAGSPYKLTRDEVENVDAGALTKKLVTDEVKAMDSYPLQKERSSYADNFVAFWTKLVLQAGDVVFDEYLMGHLSLWVEMLSNWEVRPFRHVGTVVGNTLVSALIQLHAKRSKQSQQQQRGKKGAASGDALEADRLAELARLIEALFNSVFVIRYRDVWPDIRTLCIRALGSWIPAYDSVMMDTKYVKYLGWALYDPKPRVRLAAVKVLTELYGNDAYVHQMEKFTTRFQDRLGAVPDDKDVPVAVAGIRLCNVLARAGKLNAAHVEHIHELLMDKNASIRVAAADFALTTYFGGSKRAAATDDNDGADNEDGDGDGDASSAGRKKKARGGGRRVRSKAHTQSPAEQSLLALAEFVRAPGGPAEHQRDPDTVVSVLWGCKDTAWLRDWDAMSTLLLQDEYALSAPQQSSVARVMLAAVRAAAASATKADKKAMTQFSESIVTVLHRLLERFKADRDVALALASLVKFVDVGTFADHSDNHKHVVDSLGQLVEEHADYALVHACIMGMARLAGDAQAPTASVAAATLDRTTGAVLRAFSQCAQAARDVQGGDGDDGDVEKGEVASALAGALLRLSVSYLQVDLRLNADTFALLKRVLDDRVAGDGSLSSESIVHALNAEVLDLMWSLSRLLKGAANGVMDEPAQDALVRERDDVLFHLDRLLAAAAGEGAAAAPDAVRVASIKCTVDVLKVFGAYLSKRGLARLRVTASQELCERLMGAFHALMDSTAAAAANEEGGNAPDDEDEESAAGVAAVAAKAGSALAVQLELVAAVAGAVAQRTLPVTSASHVLVHYSCVAKRVRDEMRAMLTRLRRDAEQQHRGENEYKIVLATLKLAFGRFQASNEYDEDRAALRSLSSALVRTYGPVLSVSFKASLALLMQEACPYALSLGDIGFVFLRDCLMPFTTKMPQPDKILDYFEGLQLPEAESSPYTDELEEFRNHLRKLANPSAFKTPLSKRSRKVNPRMVLQMESETGGEGGEGEQQQQQQSSSAAASPAPKPRKAGKRRTSTGANADAAVAADAGSEEPSSSKRRNAPRSARKSAPIADGVDSDDDDDNHGDAEGNYSGSRQDDEFNDNDDEGGGNSFGSSKKTISRSKIDDKGKEELSPDENVASKKPTAKLGGGKRVTEVADESDGPAVVREPLVNKRARAGRK